ncbi:MAG: helix-turn-helix domain-containing protein [Terracidiphilus sp.]
MPWRVSSVREEKLRFVYEYERDEATMRELCGRYGISRETGYVWLRRYRQHGARGLVELDRAPRYHPNQTNAEIEAAVLELRQAHMRWGPRKLKRILLRDQPGRAWPGHQHHRRDRQARRTGGGTQEATQN